MSVNLSCFQGGDRERWRLVANGASPRPHATHPDKWIEKINKAGYAIRTGGMVFPRETDLNPGLWYYRFIGTAAYSQGLAESGVAQAVFGGWWVEYETMMQIVRFAREHGDLLYDTAAYFLALPDEWGDRGRLARAMLVKPIRAWRGNGKPAQSPSGTWIPPQHMKEVYQSFLPGDPALRASAFALVKTSEDIIYTRDFEQVGWFAR